MNDKRLRLDLFRLHDPKDYIREWVLGKGCNLKGKLGELIIKSNIPTTRLVKYLMEKFNISITSAERLVYLKREWYPLVFIQELVELTNSQKYEVQEAITLLKTSSPPLVEYKAVKELTINLSKIAGAHAADGTLNSNFISVTDEYKSNINVLVGWFKEFDYNPHVIRIGQNEWGVRFHSKIISRYFTRVFGFPSGCKVYDIKEPDIIRNAPLRFRKAFVIGALTFEAGLGIKPQIEFCVASKSFRDSIIDVFNILGIPHYAMDRQSGKYWRFWSYSLTKEAATVWIGLFEPGSEKWLKLRDYVYGFSGCVDSFEEAVGILDKVYNRKSSSKVTLKDVLFALKYLKSSYRYELADYIVIKKGLESYGGKWAHSISHYLDILKRANVISVEKMAFGKKKSFGTIMREVYVFNENIKEWRLPAR